MIANQQLLDKAQELGMDACGVARARELVEYRERLMGYLAENHHGGLGYMARNVEKRLDPTLLHPHTRSVVVCALSYANHSPRTGVSAHIARYALGEDYHLLIRERMHPLLEWINTQQPNTSGRIFVDTAPLLEKAWAVEAGLGWIGRNSLLIHPTLGSQILLGVILTDAQIEPNAPYREQGCGSCRACLASCPTQAINPNRTINAVRCISRLNIEKPNPELSASTSSSEALHGWVFGCDLCLNACPYNRQCPEGNTPELQPKTELTALTQKQWLTLQEEEFQAKFGTTALSRCSLSTLQERIQTLKLEE